jgi:hypothetical protein
MPRIAIPCPASLSRALPGHASPRRGGPRPSRKRTLGLPRLARQSLAGHRAAPPGLAQPGQAPQNPAVPRSSEQRNSSRCSLLIGPNPFGRSYKSRQGTVFPPLGAVVVRHALAAFPLRRVQRPHGRIVVAPPAQSPLPFRCRPARFAVPARPHAPPPLVFQTPGPRPNRLGLRFGRSAPASRFKPPGSPA